MLENSFGLIFFLKVPRHESKIRTVYFRITVDGIPKEASTRRQWDLERWNQKIERAVGTKEDAKSLNFFLDSLTSKIHDIKTEILYSGKPITSQKIMDYVMGRITPRVKVLEEFQKHNDELEALVGNGYTGATLERFNITKNHVSNFIKFKYNADDFEFADLDLEFVKDLEFYLRSVRKCSNNTTLKYIANFKKIVIRALDKEIIEKDPFKSFKGKKTKIVKKPISAKELAELEAHQFSIERLSIVRDIFVFQCYTGLAYIDAYQLTSADIKDGVDGKPMPLLSNKGKSFQGSIVLGKGFVLSPEEAEKLIKKDPRNKDVLFPYLNGDDLNNDPKQKPSRWVINFFDWDENKAKTYPDCYEIIKKLVKPERQRWKKDNEGNEIVDTYALRKPLPQKWWIYGEKRPALYNTISELDQVMVLNRHAKHLLISICKNDIVFSEATVVFSLNTFSDFSILSSSFHDVWAWKNSSTMGASTLRYSGNNAFETFPFPITSSEPLNNLGRELHLIRLEIMERHKLGLTELQNKFHDININPTSEMYDDIIKLRGFYKAIDIEILRLYKWINIDLNHNFYELNYLPENDRLRFTINPNARKEILKRLLLLNLQLFNEESKANVFHATNHKKTKKVNITKTLNDTLFPED